MPTNLTDRLGELVDKVTPGPVDVYPQPIGSADDAKAELAFQVDTTEDRQPFLFLLNAGGKCPATTGCGPTSQANAEFIALCFTHKDEILSALRKAEEPVSGEGPQHNAGRWLADAVELIRECRLADAYALRTGDELRWDQAFHALCRFEQQVKPILADIARLSLGDEK